MVPGQDNTFNIQVKVLLFLPGQPGWVDNFEDAGLLVLPLDVAGVTLCAVVQQLLQEVPQQPAVRRRGVQILTYREQELFID